MEKETNINKTNNSTENPKFSILIKLFLAFLFFSIFTIVAISLLAVWTFYNTPLDLTPEEINIIYTNYKNNYIFVMILVIIPAIFLAISIAEHIASPVRLLKKSIKEIAQGNLNIKLETNRNDELGNLINLFNEMTTKLTEAKDRNEEISKIKNNFITVASHQLRTPVAGVRFGLDILNSEIKGPLNTEQKEILNECVQRNNETIKNIDDLLVTSRIEEENFPYELKTSLIKELMDEALKDFEMESKIKQRKIVYNNKLKTDIELVMDQNRIKTVISNLIENAIDYGTKDTDIEVNLEKEGDYILIQVENYGIGFSKTDEEKLFTKFFRADNAISTKPNGIGLGLFISKKIVEYHKGKIIASSSPQTNKTIFSVYLPIPKSLITRKEKTEEFLESI
jgi:signal transduction histidine kinase